MKNRFWLHFLLIFCFSFSLKATLLKVHNALFDTFLAFSDDEIDTTIDYYLKISKDSSYKKTQSIPNFNMILLLFQNIHILHSVSLLKSYYSLMEKNEKDEASVTKENLKDLKNFILDFKPCCTTPFPIYELPKEERLKLFNLLIRSKVNLLRRIGFSLRMFYLEAIYGYGLGKYLSGSYDEKSLINVTNKLPKFKTEFFYDSKKKKIEGEIDVLIIGSGASASVAAYNLQKAGLKVLVIEKGPFVIPGAIDTTTNFNFFESKGPRFTEDGSLGIMNAEVVGGGPSINANMSFSPRLPYVQYQFDSWREKGIIKESTWHKKDISKAYTWVKSIFLPRVIEPFEINKNNEVLLKGGMALNLSPKLYELNTYREGEGPYSVNNKKTSFDLLLMPLMLDEKNPVTLLNNCNVEKIIIEEKKAKGVKCTYKSKSPKEGIVSDLYGFDIKDEEKIRIYAKNIILAAGNLGTSSILLNSKVENKNIGVGFVNHPFVTLLSRFDEPIASFSGEPSTIYIDAFAKTHKNPNNPGFLIEAHNLKPGIGALLHPGNPKQVLEMTKDLNYFSSFSVMLIDTPHKGNYIERCKNGDLKVHYSLLPEDKERFLIGLKTGIKVAFAAGASEVTFNSFEKPNFLFDKQRANMITPDMDLDEIFLDFDFVRNQTLLFGVHMMAGNKMGQSPKNSVVDENYKVWGVDNLFVIDSSVFPSSVGANPMQTIYTSAKIFSEKFLLSPQRKLGSNRHAILLDSSSRLE